MKNMNIDPTLLPLRNFFLYLLINNKLQIEELYGILYNRKFIKLSDFEEFQRIDILPKYADVAEAAMHPENFELIQKIFIKFSELLGNHTQHHGFVNYEKIHDVIFTNDYFKTVAEN